MVWPDIPRWLWSYAIGKLRVFTNFDESKLAVGITSLSLQDVEFDTANANTRAFTATKCVVRSLTIELVASGMHVSASDVLLDGVIETLEQPDVALSTFLNSAMRDLENFGPTPPVQDQNNREKPQSMLAKLANSALGQVTVHISNTSASLQLRESPAGINVHVDSIIWSGNHRLELESITLSTYTSWDGSSKDFVESRMSQSVYFDVGSGSREPFVSTTLDSDLGTIDRVVLEYSMYPFALEISVERMRIDGFCALEFAVDTVNTLFLNGAPVSAENARGGCSQPKTFAFMLDSLEVYDFVNHGSSVCVSVEQILFKDNVLTVESLNWPDVVAINPFLRANLGPNESDAPIGIEILMPVSVHVPSSHLPAFQRMIGRIRLLLSRLYLPPSEETAQFELALPDVQIQVGDMLKVNLFADSISESEVHLREVLLTVGEGQVVIGETFIEVQKLDFMVENFKLVYCPSFAESVQQLQQIFINSDIETTPLVDSKSSFCLVPPRARFVVGNLDVRDNNGTQLTGTVKFISSAESVDLTAKLAVISDLASGNLRIHCCSFPDFSSVVGNVRVNNAHVNLRAVEPQKSSPEVSKTPQEVPENSEGIFSLVFGRFLVNLEVFLEETWVHFPDAQRTTVLLDPRNISVTAGLGKVNLLARQVQLSLLDRASGNERVHISTLNAIKCIVSDTKVDLKIKSMLLGCCADSLHALRLALDSISSEAPSHVFKVEPDADLDIFAEAENDFVVEKLQSADKIPPEIAEQPKSLQIDDNYILRPTPERSLPPLHENLSKVFQVQLGVRKFEWCLYDGYDLAQTQQTMANALSALAANARKKERNQDGEALEMTEEKAIMCELLYDSVVLTPKTGEYESIQRQVQEELQGTGDNGFSRSRNPKIKVKFKDFRLTQKVYDNDDTSVEFQIRSAEAIDDIPTSIYPKLLVFTSVELKDGPVFVYRQNSVSVLDVPEFRIQIRVNPVRLTLDQDAVEFLNRYFQFDTENVQGIYASGDEVAVYDSEEIQPLNANDVDGGTEHFMQAFDLSPLVLSIDYNPKKINYRILRSGGTAQLLNVFPIKDAKLRLKAVKLYGVNGWESLLEEILKQWMPDIRAHQLAGLVAGISPIRKLVKASRGLRRSSASRVTNVILKRTLDELNRVKSHFTN